MGGPTTKPPSAAPAALGGVILVRVPESPTVALSPNGRLDWRRKARAVAAARRVAFYAAREAIPAGSVPAWASGAVGVRLVIAWGKGQKRMDDDNAIGACKAYRDGIADALGIKDARFRTIALDQARDPDGLGYVTVELAALDGEGRA